MPLTLPNLDDRRWADLVEESRALIPVYGGEWTDHNVHDPGITLVELLAYLAELDLFQINQIPDEHKRQFLGLIGLHPNPTTAARTFLKLTLDKIVPSFDLPAGVAFTTNSSSPVRFQTMEAAELVGGDLVAIQSASGGGYTDLSQQWRKGTPIPILGTNPQVGSAVYFGFSLAVPVAKKLSLYLAFAGKKTNRLERKRIEEEICARSLDCTSPKSWNPCRKGGLEVTRAAPQTVEQQLHHQSVQVAWEFLADQGTDGEWQSLNASGIDFQDETRSLTLDGVVRFRVPAPMRAKALGPVAQKLFYVRCRIVSGMYDEAPVLRDALFNATAVRQFAPETSKLRIAPNAVLPAPAPKAGDRIYPLFEVDTVGRITKLTLQPADSALPEFLVLNYEAPGANEGSLQSESVFLGKASGFPLDHFDLPDSPVLPDNFHLFVQSASGWTEWKRRDDFEASTAADAHFVLSSTNGRLQFGDGKRGLVPDAGSLIFALGNSTRAAQGNVSANSISKLEDSLHNRAILAQSWNEANAALARVTNPLAANGGLAKETLDLASLRAIALVNSPTRAISRSDIENFALGTPGVRLARAIAIPNFHDHFPCLSAPGLVTVVVVPYLPEGKPYPSAPTRNLILSYLNRRRILGTKFRVVGPFYVGVSLQASVKSVQGTNPITVREAIVSRLEQFLDPLLGGEEGTGWPFGKHVYIADLLSVIADVPGADHVLSLSFVAAGCGTSCNEICVPQTGLVFAESLQVEVS